MYSKSLDNKDGQNYMFKLIYSSKATRFFSEYPFHQLMEKFTDSNIKNQISGILLFDGKYFLQIIEGEKNAINKLFVDRISRDFNHTDIEIIDASHCQQRMFPHFVTYFLEENTKNIKAYKKHFNSSQFFPMGMSAGSVELFLRDLGYIEHSKPLRLFDVKNSQTQTEVAEDHLHLSQSKKCGCCGVTHEKIKKHAAILKDELYWFRCICNSTLVVRTQFIVNS